MNVTLRPDRSLLDANFESYKLSLEKIPQFSFTVHEKIDYRVLSESLSKQHVQAFSHQNCLMLDPHIPGDVYYMNTDGTIHRLRVPNNPMHFSAGKPVCKLSGWSEVRGNNRIHATLKFPSISTAVLCDGVDKLFIFETQREADYPTSWKLQSTCQVPSVCDSAQLLDAVFTDQSNGLHCILASIGARTEGIPVRTKSSYITHVDWLTYRQTAPSTEWVLYQYRRFVGASFPDHVSLSHDTDALYICAEKSFCAIFDSLDSEVAARVTKPKETCMSTSCSRSSLMSTTSDLDITIPPEISVPLQWSQSEPSSDDDSGMIHVIFELNGTQFSDLEFLSKQESVQLTINPKTVVENHLQTLTVTLNHRSPSGEEQLEDGGLSNSETITLFNHPLYAFVEPKALWTIDREAKCLEVHLSKKHTLHWPRLLHDVELDQRLTRPSRENFSASEVEHMQDGLKPTASGDDVAPTAPNGTLKPAFNVEQLEEVDFPLDDEEDDLTLQRFVTEGLKVTHQVSLSGHQWLLNVPVERSGSWPCTNAVCLRHDVDGIVWLHRRPDQIAEGLSDSEGHTNGPWYHVATLQAFGYVLASKRDHRFVCSPALADKQPPSFVAVADASKHIFIYRQPLAKSMFPDGDTELRRRRVDQLQNGTKTEGVVHVAWQHVIGLANEDPIVGFVALEKPYPVCLACTESTVYLFSLIG
ncbi:NudC domain-containing protein 1 [Paragonimus heterotremus]|uniref:NudC domain-containing protein 1 n=1 Tax=Paragonimus heterotremus TaxID=100268 RepID=A0A8J4SHM8_9TREM|nr:NudC domain-containing protein 1 [Paragonimus heterotremus]